MGLLLPCIVIVRQREDGTDEMAMINPLMMGNISNPGLKPVADEVRSRLEHVSLLLKK